MPARTVITGRTTGMDRKTDSLIDPRELNDGGKESADKARLGLVLGGRHPVTLCGLSQVFENERDYAIFAICSDAETTLDAIARHQPDIVILDLERAGTFKVLRRAHRHAPSVRIVVLTSAPEHDQMADALRVGARAVIRKELPPDAFVACVRRVHAGESFDGPGSDGVVSQLSKVATSSRRATRQLTPRETEIARLAVLGVPTREIADRLAVKQGTVKIHLHSIYDKLNVGGRLGLVLVARRHGLA
jgi:DNA-binding NarL/FixJ family response regulator